MAKRAKRAARKSRSSGKMFDWDMLEKRKAPKFKLMS
jgi:hypothetical protein